MMNSLAKKFTKGPPKGLLLSYKYSISDEKIHEKQQLNQLNVAPTLETYTKFVCKSSGIAPEYMDPIYKTALEFCTKYGAEIENIFEKHNLMAQRDQIQDEILMDEEEEVEVEDKVEEKKSSIYKLVEDLFDSIQYFIGTCLRWVFGSSESQSSSPNAGKARFLSVFAAVSWTALSSVVSKSFGETVQGAIKNAVGKLTFNL